MSTEPPTAKRPKDESEDLPKGWTSRVSKSRGIPYYVCTATGETRWERPTEPAPEAASSNNQPKEVRVLHILAKHKDSRRPSSWRQAVITRSKDEAARIIERHRAAIIAGEAKFEDIAKSESDCSSASKGGDLGSFGPGQMQPAFEKASFALKVGEISPLVFTDSGVHIIKRLA